MHSFFFNKHLGMKLVGHIILLIFFKCINSVFDFWGITPKFFTFFTFFVTVCVFYYSHPSGCWVCHCGFLFYLLLLFAVLCFSFFVNFLNLNLFSVCECFAYIYVSLSLACLVPLEAWRRASGSLNWSYISLWFWVTVWVLAPIIFPLPLAWFSLSLRCKVVL